MAKHSPQVIILSRFQRLVVLSAMPLIFVGWVLVAHYLWTQVIFPKRPDGLRFETAASAEDHHQNIKGQLDLLQTTIADLARAQMGFLKTVERRRAWEITSLDGKCHPDLERLIESAWRASSRRNTLEEVKDLAMAESNFRPWAVSPKGAIGLFQVMPSTGHALGYSIADLLDPRINAIAGLEVLDAKINECHGDLDCGMRRYVGLPPPKPLK